MGNTYYSYYITYNNVRRPYATSDGDVNNDNHIYNNKQNDDYSNHIDYQTNNEGAADKINDYKSRELVYDFYIPATISATATTAKDYNDTKCDENVKNDDVAKDDWSIIKADKNADSIERIVK